MRKNYKPCSFYLSADDADEMARRVLLRTHSWFPSKPCIGVSSFLDHRAVRNRIPYRARKTICCFSLLLQILPSNRATWQLKSMSLIVATMRKL